MTYPALLAGIALLGMLSGPGTAFADADPQPAPPPAGLGQSVLGPTTGTANLCGSHVGVVGSAGPGNGCPTG